MRDDPEGAAPETLNDEGGALRFLLNAGELLSSSLDFRQTLASIGRLAVPALADFVVIDLVQPDGSVRRECSLHVRPEREEMLRDLPGTFALPPADGANAAVRAAAVPEPIFLTDASRGPESNRIDSEQHRLLQTLEVRSFISAPLVVRDRVLGGIAMGLSERTARYDRTHFEVVVELARRAAFTMDHALLYATAEKAREDAEQSRTVLQELVRASDHVIVEFDVNGRYLSIASTAAPLVYRPQDELLGRTVHEVFPAETADHFAEWIQQAIVRRRSVEIEYPLTIEGRRVWFGGSVSPIGEDRAVWFVRDVTERRVAAEALAESERRFRATFEQAAVGISHIDLSGRFLRVNQKLADIVGYARDELLRLTFQDITHPDDRAAHVAQSERLLSGEIDSYTIEKRYQRKGGDTVWVSVTGSLVRGDEGRPDYFISVIQDMSDRKELEEQLIRAQKMEAVGRMVGGMAHEFNNALTTITGFTDLVLRGLPEQDPLRPDLEEISRAAWRAAGVASRLMVFSSSGVTEPQVVDLGRVVADAQRMLAQLIGEDIELELDLHAEPTHVHADRRQLEQIIVNLAVNARDAMPEGGSFRVGTSVVHLDEASAGRLGDLPAAEYVCLTLEDTGQGMSPEVQGRIFDPFFTTKQEGKGTGLGLSIVYGIVRRAEGGIDVESEVGRGTTFRIFLPRVEAAKRARVIAGEAPRSVSRSERVLLVEDDAGVRNLAERVMKRLGYSVVAAPDPDEALRVVHEEGLRFDLLVTDLVMPHMSGRELAARLTPIQPELRVLFTSGYTSDPLLRRQVEASSGEFLEKPFAPEELEQALQRVLER